MLLDEWYVSELSLADMAPGLAAAVEEELRRAAAAMGRDVEFNSFLWSTTRVRGAGVS